MAQRQFTTHEYEVVSFELREALLGLLTPGRYCGYDAIEVDIAPNGTIPINITHALTGVKKGSNATPPVLSNNIGVAITTQGTIIHEDSAVSVAPTKNTDADYERLDVVYMEHSYVQVPGTNPAIYGVKAGNPGTSGVPPVEPALDSPNKQIIIGVIRHSANSTTVANLTWEPKVPTVGDNSLFKSLFGTDAETPTDAGSTPVIGDRVYTDQYVVTDEEELAASIDFLDQEANIVDQAITAIGDRAPDSSLWGALTDITHGDASITAHGFLPKLPNDAEQAFFGDGVWRTISQLGWSWRTGIAAADFSKVDFGDFVAASGVLDLSSIVPAGTTMISFSIITVVKDTQAYPTMNKILYFAKSNGAGDRDGPYVRTITYVDKSTISVVEKQIMMGIDPNNMELYWYNFVCDDLQSANLTIVGWYSPV